MRLPEHALPQHLPKARLRELAPAASTARPRVTAQPAPLTLAPRPIVPPVPRDTSRIARPPRRRAALLVLGLVACRPAPPEGPYGALEKDAIRTVVRANHHQIRECYNRGLARERDLAGRVEILFVIGPTGAVTSSSAQSTTLPLWARFVGRCIARAARGWQFPAPEGGGSVVVTYPFILEPG